MPAGVDILVTHGPASGRCDGGKGCHALARRVAQLRPRLVVCGHIHYAYGAMKGHGEDGRVNYVNASNCDEERRLAHPPIVVDI